MMIDNASSTNPSAILIKAKPSTVSGLNLGAARPGWVESLVNILQTDPTLAGLLGIDDVSEETML